MQRVLSLWLPRFSTDRLCRRREAADGHAPTPWRSEPLVTLTAEGGRGERLVSVNRAAELVGLAPDRTLADARALVPGLRALEHDSMDEIKALAALADWCGRYSPWTAVDGIEANGAGGIWIDITGVAHLFGGEEALLADLTARLDSFGYISRAGLSDTPGAAWALARFGGVADSNWRVEAPGTGAQTLASLPVAGLRLTPQIHASLLRLGLRTIGDVLPLPRAGLSARFGTELVRRIDQALGRIKEPIMPRPSALVTRLRLALPEPVGRPKDITAAAHRLLTAMCQRLERSRRGVRQLELALYRIDGHVTRVPVGTNCASRNPDHLIRLLATSLERLPDHASTEALVDLLVLTVRSSTPLASVQSTLHRTLTDTSDTEDHAALAALNDRLVNRLGATAVRQLWTRASHLPERAQVSAPAGTMPKVAVKARSYSLPTPPPYKGEKNSQNGLLPHKASPSVEESCAGVDKNKSHPNNQKPPRPLRLLAPPQSVEATALVSDEPPCLFRWQGQMYRVAHADGPERLAPEWWRGSTMPNDDDLARRTRDYYRVEDTRGRRFWLYREGLYGATAPRWFLHGLFG